tara:strand:+ start:2078 stop:2998 length:921 start_codon:yes stop_codon:yes gene_type:complete
MRHLLSLFDLASDEIRVILDTAVELKREWAAGNRQAHLEHCNLALLFEKPSLRTRVSFECGMSQLGGHALYLGQDVGWGKRESVKDFSEVLSEYVDVIACRSYKHETVEQLVKYSSVPVINALTDYSHPCQALADILTVQEEFGSLNGRHLAFVGDANNVSRSLAIACGKMGVRFTLACPEAYQFSAEEKQKIEDCCEGFEFAQSTDAVQAVSDADAIYTDVWASMGQEKQQKQREQDFAIFQVNQKLMQYAPEAAIFLHCLPAKRGQEVTDEVMDGSQSRIVSQAGNRMHAQKGLLVWLLAQQST